MVLQSITNINIDFCDKKYIMVNAKQNDKNSRFLLVACYNRGDFYPINKSDHSTFVRCKKSDGYSVFNACDITDDKKILVELTEQMLASAGICHVDLIVANRGSARLDPDTGEVVSIDNASILSTMTFCIDVSETAIDNSEIESTYEFDGFNATIEKITAEYQEVVRLAKSYATGNAGGIRDDEDTDNAKYYYEQSLENVNNASGSEINALNSYNLAKSYAIGGTGTRANEDKDNAKYYCQMVKDIVNNFENGFVPMGTVAFSELATVEKVAGFIYNISDDFVTDSTFKEGAGKSYTAGTNVYCTADGYWDCFGGSVAPTATVDEVKDYLGI